MGVYSADAGKVRCFGPGAIDPKAPDEGLCVDSRRVWMLRSPKPY
jgi:hypothetical protein